MQRKARHIRSGIMNSGERVFLGSEAVRVEAEKKGLSNELVADASDEGEQAVNSFRFQVPSCLVDAPTPCDLNYSG